VKNHDYRYCVTMDADEQHEPDFVPCFVEKLGKYDIVSGSRYLNPLLATDHPPADRLEVNKLITEKLRTITGYPLTDSFCGFKGYRVEALRKLQLTEPNYGFPIQFWLRAAKAGLTFTELAVPLIYKDYSRNFNDQFAGRDERLNHYLRLIEAETQERLQGPRSQVQGPGKA
jgi:dolichol-phosphate mannosyltransferase